MRGLLLLAALLAAARAQCTLGVTDELEYTCPVNAASIQVRARKNEYVNVKCTGTNFTCDDMPEINLANNRTIQSLGITYCSPAILRCIYRSFQAAGALHVNVIKPTEAMTYQDAVALIGVENVMINHGKENTLPDFLLNSLPSLKDLRIQDGGLTLSPFLFSNGSHPLESLELSADGIADIPPDMFGGLDNLQHLSMWSNNIRRLGKDALKGLQSLKQLTLNNNRMSAIELGALAHTPHLETIYLTQNSFQEIPAGLFAGLDQLEMIDLKMNFVPLTLADHSLSNLPSLKNLIFSYSNIKSIGEQALVGSKSLQTISLDYNDLRQIPDNLFSDQGRLNTLDLSHNRLQNLSEGVFVSLKKLEKLNLDHNLLESLPNFLFSGLRNLKHVSLNHNLLKTFTDTTFQGAVALEYLSIESNQLHLKSEMDYGNFEQNSPFSSLVNLKQLLLASNQLDTIFNDWKNVLLKLDTLDLSGNKYIDLQEIDVNFLASDVTIDLRHNSISSIMLGYAWFNTPARNSSNSVMLLGDNPLECDCRLFQLVNRLKGATSTSTEPRFDLDNAMCQSPPRLEKKIVLNLSPYDLTCDLDEECPQNCISCEERPQTLTLELDCLTVPRQIPEIPNHTVKLRLHEEPVSIPVNFSVATLNLTGLGIEKLMFEPTDTLRTLDISNNKLKVPPVEILKRNISLYISNNPLECECWYYDELYLLKNSKFVEDYNKVSCSNGVFISELDMVALCGAWRAAAVATGTFIVLVIILTITAILCARYANEIMVYMAYKSVFRKIIYIDNTDSDKEYDVFLSFSHKDIKFVEEELIPKLEDDFKQKICVHYRDWNVGEFITTQINRSVETSKKTVIVLSKNFLESEWATVEFNVAHNLTVKDNVARVLLILLEDVTKEPKLTAELKAYINMNTYLMYGDPQFWKKLRKALPQRKVKFVWQHRGQRPADVVEKPLKGGLDVQLNSDNQLVNAAFKDV